MIKSISFTNEFGEVLDIGLRSPEQSGFFIKNIEGIGPSKATINMTTEGISFDGGFYNSSKVTSRNIVFDLGFYYDGVESIEAIRLKTYKYFVMKKPLEVQIETDSRIGVTTGYVESNEPDIFSKQEGAIISIVCPSAFFRDKNPTITTFSGVSNGFEFPFENPSLTESLIQFGSVFINTQQTVLYTGDEETGVVVVISVLGAVNNLAVHNTTTGQSMVINSTKLIALTGSDLIAGDVITITTLRGNKSVYLKRGGISTNILNAVDRPAAWFRLQRGDNVFTYTAQSGLSNLQFLIQHYRIYGGL